MFTKVLVANRGEIAIRAFRAAYELGAGTVAVFPYEDRNSVHRLKADEAYQIGEVGHPVRAYLSVEEIIAAAERAGADAIYPGYGFLSENPDLAAACEANGITFVGPSAEVLELTGNKARAIAVCIDDRAAANRIVELCRGEFPLARLLVRAFDREHALELVALGVDYHIRETFESAVLFGRAALEEIGVGADEAQSVSEEVRRLDAERFTLEVAAGDVRAGRPLIIDNTAPATPTPFTTPRRESQRLDRADGRAEATDA